MYPVIPELPSLIPLSSSVLVFTFSCSLYTSARVVLISLDTLINSACNSRIVYCFCASRGVSAVPVILVTFEGVNNEPVTPTFVYGSQGGRPTAPPPSWGCSVGISISSAGGADGSDSSAGGGAVGSDVLFSKDVSPETTCPGSIISVSSSVSGGGSLPAGWNFSTATAPPIAAALAASSVNPYIAVKDAIQTSCI